MSTILSIDIRPIGKSFVLGCVAHSNEPVFKPDKLSYEANTEELSFSSDDQFYTIFVSEIDCELDRDSFETFEKEVLKIVEGYGNLKAWFDYIRSGVYSEWVDKTHAWRIV